MIVMGIRSAEMTKYAANCMLATKISFMNEIANICERVGADVRDVRIGIGSDKRIGYHFIYPGVGYGGSCFPKDVKALINTAHANGYPPDLVSAVDAVNNRQKLVLAEKIKQHFKPQGGVKGKTLAIWGLSFKANTDDIREAASLTIMDALTSDGMHIQAYDPQAGDNAKQHLVENPLVTIMDDQYAVLQNSDALAVVTDWNQFRNPDFMRIRKALNSPVIFDGRNLYPAISIADQGFVYHSIGRTVVGQQSK
jgi:UDPglucose 6-dehydrogenase